MAYRSTKKYERNETIILAFDIGTTHSAVSFSYAYPGEFPDIRSVVKWPGQPEASGDSKIPTIVAYQGGEAKFFGAEAREYLDDEDFEVARWFKLHLHPESMKFGQSSTGLGELDIPPLPLGVSLPQVYADFIRYTYKATKDFFINNTPNGHHIWSRLEDRMPIIFCTPNGWDMSEHAFLTEAAIRAGIVKHQDAEEQLWFITEGEASVHYSLAYTKTAEWLKKDTVFAVTDAGGSTVDSTLYRCRFKSPLVLEEVCASACVQAGGVFVDRAMQNVLEGKLSTSNYGDAETIAIMVRQFELKTKRIFDGSQISNIINFGTPRDNDKGYGIVKGKLTLTSDEVRAAYTGVISSITASCQGLLGSRRVQHLLLVGGFGESPYLRDQLKLKFGERGTQVVTVDEPSRKAAADGAVIWYLTQLVEGRAARFDYGIYSGEIYDSVVHRGHEDEVYLDDAGSKRVWTFRILISKDTILNDAWRVSWSRHRLFPTRPSPRELGVYESLIYVWQGEGPAPPVLDADYSKPPLGLRVMFTIKADLSALCDSMEFDTNRKTGRQYWKVNTNLDIIFTNMKLKARLRWMDKGAERIGPATMIPASKL
ncbi:hypothetical protein FRC15_011216 [Serendipita sp. 397]|nr:hypothetical protein FRC15_011216 [Serendipita sp. 397]KAG8793132.1 hypothetical protein FRC16_011131 [Serendipita sp. 398]